MAELFLDWQGIAGTAIILSIIIGGIALGLGKAFFIKRLEHFGAEEILQSIINGALLGFVVVLSVLILEIGKEFTSPLLENVSCVSNATPTDLVLCRINATTRASYELSQNLSYVQNTLGYYQTLVLHFGNFSIQPLINLNTISTQLAHNLYFLQLSMFGFVLNTQFLSFISSAWFGVLFATGLVLRTFFFSRKFGAFLIAVSITFILFYPLCLLMLPLPLNEIETSKNLTANFLSNSAYQTIPIIDLNDNNAIAKKIYNMSFDSNTDFTGDLGLIIQQTTQTAGVLVFYSLVVPFFVLLIALVLIKELSHSFGGEIATGVVQI